MNSDIYLSFLSGAIAMGLLVIALYFFKFWKKTKDRLFLLFALAFAVMTLERTMIAVGDFDVEVKPFVYLIRLVGFILIILGVVDKNRRG